MPPSGSLAEQRHRFVTELQNDPALRERFMRIMYNEQGANPLGTLGIAESAMNRALERHACGLIGLAPKTLCVTQAGRWCHPHAAV